MASGWRCACGSKWYHCATHNAPHLDGTPLKRILREVKVDEEPAKRQRWLDAPLPEPEVRPIQVRKRRAPTDEVVSQVAVDQQPTKRYKLLLPHVLQLRFPHLSE